MTIRFLLTFALIAITGTTTFQTAPALTILTGSDYLSTAPGTFIDFSLYGSPFGLGVVELEGTPTGPGNTDTIVERKDDATVVNPGDTDTVEIELVALSLQSVSPVDIGGTFFDISVGLDGTQPSVGELELTLDNAGTPSGTFSSFFDVFVEISLVDASTGVIGPTFSGFPSLRLEGIGNWTSELPPQSVVVTGPPGDQTANTHDPLSPDSFDFYIDGLVVEEHPGGGARHVARFSVIPEPGTTTVLCIGAIVLGLRRRRTA